MSGIQKPPLHVSISNRFVASAISKKTFQCRTPCRINTDTDGNSDPGSLLNASTDELQVHPMGGVASMISSVVSHTATVAATTAGGKVPATRNTFGKRNIKNQVSISIFFF